MSDSGIDHALVQDSIAAFADGELGADERQFVENHLRSCASCRRELDTQRRVSAALGPPPAVFASNDLRRSVQQIGRPARRTAISYARWAVPAALALLLFGIGGRTVFRSRFAERDSAVATVPLLRDAVADCRRVMGRNFPRKADLRAVAEGLPFAVEAVDRPGAELFSTWKTTLAGSPAAGLAYRWGGMVVVQYAVPAELIRHVPAMAEAIRKAGSYSISEGGQAIVADARGSLFVAEGSPERLRRLVL
jgi:Putative zinc-finger